MLKLQRFDGSESLDMFLLKFQSMARYMQWNEEDAMMTPLGVPPIAPISAEVSREQQVKSCRTSDCVRRLPTSFSSSRQGSVHNSKQSSSKQSYAPDDVRVRRSRRSTRT